MTKKPQEEILISVPIEAAGILEVAAELYRYPDTNPTLLDALTKHILQLDKLLAEARAKVVSLVPAKPRNTR